MTEQVDRTRDIHVEHRPWGHFRQYATNEQVTVKTITVDPGQRLSLQRHARRSELWHVIDAAVEVTVGDGTWIAGPGEDVWIPVGTLHRIGNRGGRPATVVEVAFGDFDESDIERVEDDYSR